MSRYPLIQLPAPYAKRDNDPLEERTTSQEVLFDGKFVRLVRDQITLPDGGHSQRLYLSHGGAAAMAALGEDGTILLERQWRHPLRQSFWELPAGKIDPGEDELDCARRELIEECGVEAERFTRLGVINNAIGYSNEHIVIYLAEGLSETEQKLDEGENLEVWRVPFDEAVRMATDGRITDVKTICGIFWVKELLAKRG
ncbi:NUDIX domain-containing protein [Sutterella sp.]|uniref:NUDIX domain-containing protein n=1 Tax=Sutterella sp. TaxID=1981025 RepID=UPI0026DFA353|nr:NUDIX hydrolase [Sutterella sp.]MDO5532041.1 NUDIX hydrolase [Sutterella sp.]